MNEETKDTIERELTYSWVGHPGNREEEDQWDAKARIGGPDPVAVVQVNYHDDGSMSLEITSSGIGNKQELVNFFNSVHTIVQHDFLETQSEQRKNGA